MIKRRVLFPVLLVLSASVLAGGSVWAGDGWFLKIQHGSGEQSAQAELRLDGNRIRAGETGVPQEVILETKGLTVLDHDQNGYMVITYQQIQSTLGPLMRAAKEMSRNQQKALDDAMEGLSAEERAEVEAQLGNLDDGEEALPTIEIESVDGSETIAGLDADKIVVKRDGTPVAEAWVTDQIPLDPFKHVLNQLAPLLEGMEHDGPGPEKYWSVVDELPGFPLKVVDVSGDGPVEIYLVTVADRQKLKKSDFAPPGHYKKTMMGLGSFDN